MIHSKKAFKRLINAFLIRYEQAHCGFFDSEVHAAMLGEYIIREWLENNETRELKIPCECTTYGNEKINVYSITRKGEILNIKEKERKGTKTKKISIDELIYADRNELFWQLLTEAGLNENYNKRMNKQNELIPLF